MLCELNECESGGCPRKRELPLDVKKLGGGRQNTLRAGGEGCVCVCVCVCAVYIIENRSMVN